MPGEDFRLGDFIAGLDWERLPERVRTTARMCILDAIGCALAGSRCAVLDQHVQNIMDQGQEGPQAVWGGRYRLQPAWAIFYNAHTAAYYDLDDGHRRAQGHPGAVIVPTALVTAAHLQRSGREVLEAVVAGYEIAVRSALRIRSQGGPRKGSAGWAAIGAAAAAAHLMHCSPQQCLNAVGLAEYYAPQAPQDRSASFPSEMKEGIPWGAYTGFTTAALAAGGFQAMRPYLADAPFGVDLGTTWEIEKTYFKKYASCRWAHPALDSLLEMMANQTCRPREIEQIRVYTFEKALLMKRHQPATVMEAVYSIPFAISCFLHHGRLGPEQLTRENFADEAIGDLARRVTLIADPVLTAGFPELCRQRVEVDFVDGGTYLGPLLAAKGDPDNPYLQADLIDKFRWLTAASLGDRTGTVINLVKELERHPAVNLVTLLAG